MLDTRPVRVADRMPVVDGGNQLAEHPVMGDHLADLERTNAIGEVIDLVLDPLDRRSQLRQATPAVQARRPSSAAARARGPA